jgi:GNAT superfamily N-acetyltransferase
MTQQIDIIHADISHIESVAELFDCYRVWYGKTADISGARDFLSQRLRNNESQIFLATVDERPAGIAQLYPLFSSVSMRDIWLLNDLFVAESHRKIGVGSLLLKASAEFARQLGALRLELATEVTNQVAQSAYESLGSIQDKEFLHYSLPLD